MREVHKLRYYYPAGGGVAIALCRWRVGDETALDTDELSWYWYAVTCTDCLRHGIRAR